MKRYRVGLEKEIEVEVLIIVKEDFKQDSQRCDDLCGQIISSA